MVEERGQPPWTIPRSKSWGSGIIPTSKIWAYSQWRNIFATVALLYQQPFGKKSCLHSTRAIKDWWQFLREKVWFPGIDDYVKTMINKCLACQANGPENRPDPLQISPLSPGPLHTVHVDFCGPFPTGVYLLVIIDAYSRFPEVEIVWSTSANSSLPKFATHSKPQLCSDLRSRVDGWKNTGVKRGLIIAE